MFASDIWFPHNSNFAGLKGNTGINSGAVPATVIPFTLLYYYTIVPTDRDEKVDKSRESQETCLIIFNYLSELSGERQMMWSTILVSYTSL